MRLRRVAVPQRGCARRPRGLPLLGSLIAKTESFSISGEMKVFRRMADSGNPIDCHFCPTCGVRLNHDPKKLSGTYKVKPGSLDDCDWLAPAVQVWTKRKQSWVTLPADLAEVEGQP